MASDALEDHLERHEIMPALGHDDVGVALAGLHKLLVHRLYSTEILGRDRLEAAPTLLDIAQDAANDAHIGVGVHKNLDVEQAQDLGILEDEDALDQQHLSGRDRDRLGRAVVYRKIVDGRLHRPARLKLTDMLHKQVGIERIGVVVIERSALVVCKRSSCAL